MCWNLTFQGNSIGDRAFVGDHIKKEALMSGLTSNKRGSTIQGHSERHVYEEQTPTSH